MSKWFSKILLLFLLIPTFIGCIQTSEDASKTLTLLWDGLKPLPVGSPLEVAAEPGDGQNLILWSQVDGATSYNIYYSTIGEPTTADPKITTSSTSYMHTGLTNNTEYYYSVSAVKNIFTTLEESSLTSASTPSIPTSIYAFSLAGFSKYKDGIGRDSRFYHPGGTTVSGDNLYVADTMNHIIRKVVLSTGEVSTFAGRSGRPGSIDGTGDAALFSYPYNITTDGNNLYVSGITQLAYEINLRKIEIATGKVTTMSTGGILYINGMVSDGNFLYLSDAYKIQKIKIGTGSVSILAGNSPNGYSIDGTGNEAGFKRASSMTIVGNNLYVTDNFSIRKIVIATGEVTTIAGTAGTSGSIDGIGTSALFGDLGGITSDGQNLYVADGYKIRKIELSSSIVTTLATFSSSFNFYNEIIHVMNVSYANNSIYISSFSQNTIIKLTVATGEISTIAGGNYEFGSSDGVGSTAQFSSPGDISTDGSNLYIIDSGNNTIRKISIATGEVTTLAGSPGLTGSDDGIGGAARFSYPDGIATDGTNLYVADTGNSTIRKISIATGEVTTLAGSPGLSGSDDGIGTAAKFAWPESIAYSGNFIYLTGYKTIRKIDLTTHDVTTIPVDFGRYDITTDGINLYVAGSKAGGFINNTDDYVLYKINIETGTASMLTVMDNDHSPGKLAILGGCITTDGTHYIPLIPRLFTRQIPAAQYGKLADTFRNQN